MVNFGIIYASRLRALEPRDPREEAQTCIDAYWPLPHVQDFIQRTRAAARDGYVTTLFGRWRPVAQIRLDRRPAPRRAARGELGHAGHGGDVIKRRWSRFTAPP
jgi:DNA polymerase I-like protein with 3'-5' exonuclease and polymerase domains